MKMYILYNSRTNSLIFQFFFLVSVKDNSSTSTITPLFEENEFSDFTCHISVVMMSLTLLSLLPSTHRARSNGTPLRKFWQRYRAVLSGKRFVKPRMTGILFIFLVAQHRNLNKASNLSI